MKWWPSECQPGDIIRIQIGSIYHYGIFVSENEIIQFGPPPIMELPPDREVVVCSDSIDNFCCGRIVEVACLDRKELKKRIPPEETIRLARGRLGEGGYNLIHNNCEHFVYQCVFGVKKSVQEEEARRRWNSRPICDVYVAEIPVGLVVESVYPPERNREIENTPHEGLRQQRFLVWKLLEYAIGRSFNLKMSDLRFSQNRFGKWTCEKVWFSLAHTESFVAVAVSNSPIGVDLENIPVFLEKHSSSALEALEKIATANEWGSLSGREPTDVLTLWVKKESVFKCSGNGRFRPYEIDTTDALLSCRKLNLNEPLLLALCGERASRAQYYLYNNNTARLIGSALNTNWMNA